MGCGDWAEFFEDMSPDLVMTFWNSSDKLGVPKEHECLCFVGTQWPLENCIRGTKISQHANAYRSYKDNREVEL